PSQLVTSSSMKETSESFQAVIDASTSREALLALEEFEKELPLKELRDEIREITSQFNASPYPLEAVGHRLEALQQIEEQTKRALEEAKAVLKTRAPNRLEKLLHLKVLEAAVIGSKAEYLGKYSLQDHKALHQSAKELLNYQKEFS